LTTQQSHKAESSSARVQEVQYSTTKELKARQTDSLRPMPFVGLLYVVSSFKMLPTNSKDRNNKDHNELPAAAKKRNTV
jgi:hypothetical protein